jgi:16S rRNA (guanine527-N7)-methyltransferase
MSDGAGSMLEHLQAASAADAEARFDAFCSLLTKWNHSIKLVSMKAEGELRERHLADSLSIVPHVRSGDRVVDVGAGGGFPGVVIAIACPTAVVTSLEPIHKKHAFLATVRRELGLTNFQPLPERDQEHATSMGFIPYDVAVSRATFAVPLWLERGLALVRTGGIVIAMEGLDEHPLPTATVRVPYSLGDRRRSLLVRTRKDPR